ncbi:hypothetical protein JCM15519_38000 [Fundidesulfovibrio butyratiphilus]
MACDPMQRLDDFDKIISTLRPLEKLFHLIGAIDPTEHGQSVQDVAEIGVALIVKHRANIEEIFSERSERERIEVD